MLKCDWLIHGHIIQMRTKDYPMLILIGPQND